MVDRKGNSISLFYSKKPLDSPLAAAENKREIEEV